MNGINHQVVRVAVRGDAACFRRPEFVDDLISYDVLPPLVATRILDAIYRPAYGEWHIDRIEVLRPIRVEWRRLATARGSRRTLTLVDVHHVVQAKLRLQNGDDFIGFGAFDLAVAAVRDRIHLGLRDFPAELTHLSRHVEQEAAPITDTMDLGWLPFDTDRSAGARIRFIKAAMRAGVVDVAGSLADRVLAS